MFTRGYTVLLMGWNMNLYEVIWIDSSIPWHPARDADNSWRCVATWTPAPEAPPEAPPKKHMVCPKNGGKYLENTRKRCHWCHFTKFYRETHDHVNVRLAQILKKPISASTGSLITIRDDPMSHPSHGNEKLKTHQPSLNPIQWSRWLKYLKDWDTLW